MNTLKLPLDKIFTKSLFLPFQKIPALLKYVLPILIIGVIVIYNNEGSVSQDFATPQPSLSLQDFFFISLRVALFTLALSIIEVASYRAFLNADKVKLKREIIIVLRYAGALVLLTLFYLFLCLVFFLMEFMFLAIIFGSIDINYLQEAIRSSIGNGTTSTLVLLFFIITIFIGVITINYAMIKFLLVLPIVAMDKKLPPFFNIWNASKNNGWRLIILIILLPLVVVFIINFIEIILSAISLSFALNGSSIAPLIIGAISTVSLLYILMMKVALLALSYQHFLEHDEQGNLTAIK